MAPRFTIRDETVHAAFDMLEANAQPAAAARAMKERREDERRAAKARAYQKATGTVGDREAEAIKAAAATTDKNPVYKTVVREMRTLQSTVESPSGDWNLIRDKSAAGSFIQKLK